jgi:hypothetical protein
MRLPRPEDAVVDEAKIRDYLLSESHPVGRFKALVFRRIGYVSQNWQTLAADLKRFARDNDAVAIDSNAFGRKYAVRGTLKGPKGDLSLATVWIVLVGETFPRFVTAYPRPKS